MNPSGALQTQRSTLPLPPATMIIDMRGEGEDIVNMLKVEVRNLADEMKLHHVRLWSKLADFISFQALEPMGDEAIKALQPSQPQASLTTTTPEPDGASAAQSIGSSRTLTGGANPPDKAASFPPQYQVANQNHPEDVGDDDLVAPHPSFDRLVYEINRIRNIRINAVSDLGREGIVGPNVKEPTVRVIFLADARHPNSLISTAACAAYLKAYYGRLERPDERTGLQVPIDTSVLCVNHRNTDQDHPPAHLIEGLCWQGGWNHLNAVILSEEYRQDIGWVDAETQALLVELLLYVLLVVSPALVQIRPSPPAEPDDKSGGENQQRIALPPNTYLVGLSSIENSMRWGYRLLNYGLAEQALQVLQDGDLGDEQMTTANVVEGWLNRLRALVRSALPDKLPGDTPALRALSQAAKAATPTQGVFTNSRPSLTMGKGSIRELEHYLNTVSATYTLSDEAQNPFRQQIQSLPAGKEAYLPPTLQSAVDSIPQIEKELDEWESSGQETPLAQAQREAQRVLGKPPLFLGAHGAIPRAKLQLKDLGAAIAALQSKHRQNPVNVKARQQALRDSGSARINGLKTHVEDWPLFAGLLGLKAPLTWLSALFAVFLGACLVILGFVWLNQLILSQFPSLTPFITTPLFGTATFTVFYLVLWLVLLAVVLLTIFVFGRVLVDQKHSALTVESTFCLMLLTIALVGWLSYVSLLDGPVQRSLLIWYFPAWLPWISIIALLVTLVIVLTEVGYFVWWHRALERERMSVADAIRSEHQRNIEEITSYIADMLSLHLLVRAGLTDGKGGTGTYYKRVDELSALLDATSLNIKEQRRLAEGRLGSNLDEASLRIRQELLDVGVLKLRYKELGSEMQKHKRAELEELAEILLRTIGEEMPSDIERQFREKAPQGGREQYYAQILVEVLTSVALHFSIAIPASDMLTPIKERCGELDGQATGQLTTLQSLIETLEAKVRAAPIDSEDSSSTGLAGAKDFDIPLAAQALAAWGQMLWERKDDKLVRILAPGGVIAKLVRDKYSPQTIKETLGIRTSPSGRSIVVGLYDELYLFVSSSPESRKFLKDFLPERHIADFPDTERLLLMQIRYYVAKPIFVSRLAIGSGQQPRIVAAKPISGQLGPGHSNGTVDAANGQPPSGNNASTDTQQATVSGAQPLSKEMWYAGGMETDTQQAAVSGAQPAPPPQAKPVSSPPAPSASLDPQLAKNFQRYETHLAREIAGEPDPSVAIDDPDLDRPIHARLAQIQADPEALKTFVNKHLTALEKFADRLAADPTNGLYAFALAKHCFAIRAGEQALGKPPEQLLPWPVQMQQLLGQVQDADLQRLVQEDMALTPL